MEDGGFVGELLDSVGDAAPHENGFKADVPAPRLVALLRKAASVRVREGGAGARGGEGWDAPARARRLALKHRVLHILLDVRSDRRDSQVASSAVQAAQVAAQVAVRLLLSVSLPCIYTYTYTRTHDHTC